MSYLKMINSQSGPMFDPGESEGRGLELRERYCQAMPYPHVVIDDFLPTSVLEKCLEKFPQQQSTGDSSFDRPQERLKFQYNPDSLDINVRTLFYALNSAPFLKVLQNITGIQGLIPDPYFIGGGLHEIRNGGHLSVHADFNHHTILDLERRINILIYLNRDWKEDYGGQLELWNNEMTVCQQSISPSFGRCVMFNTTSSSNHGNPRVVSNPLAISRKSLALYYYTATWSEEKIEHTTQFRKRGGTSDKLDMKIKTSEFMREVLPPILCRKARTLLNRLSKALAFQS